MRYLDSLKTTLAWLLLIVSAVAGFRGLMSAGLTQISYAVMFVVCIAVVFRWRQFLNTIRNTETSHYVEVVNASGDAIYRRSTSLLPLFWPIGKTEVFMSMSAKEGVIENPRANYPVDWLTRSPRTCRGKVMLPSHRPLLFRFGRTAGVRVEISANWRRAFAVPPFDFVVATGERPSGRIEIRLRWRREAMPLEARAEYAVYPVKELRGLSMIETDRLPWFVESNVSSKREDGDMLMDYVVSDPKPSHMYRVVWRY